VQYSIGVALFSKPVLSYKKRIIEVLVLKAPTYLRVDVTFTPDGKVIPITIYWTDGAPFSIDRILDVRPGSSLKHGGAGIRYHVRIRNQERDLFCVENRWFIEEVDQA
jgi:hypothetical protein